MRLRSVVLAASVFALGLSLAACKPKLNENNPDGEDPAINGGELTEEAKAHSVDPPAEDAGEGDIMSTGPDVAILPEFSVKAADGKTRLTFSGTTDAYEISGSIDPKIAAFDPALADQYARVMAQEASNFASAAKTDKAEAAKISAESGEPTWFNHAYGLDTGYRVAAEAGNMISVLGFQWMFTGGAHGNYGFSGAIFQKGADTPESMDAFIADKNALKVLLLDGLADQKIEKGYTGAKETVRGEVSDALSGSDAWSDNFVLNASSVPEKFGGITILFAPYEIGSYAEGAYEVTIPAAKLKPILTADRAALFGGEPKNLPEMARSE